LLSKHFIWSESGWAGGVYLISGKNGLVYQTLRECRLSR
jgi:hypothetical protein